MSIRSCFFFFFFSLVAVVPLSRTTEGEVISPLQKRCFKSFLLVDCTASSNMFLVVLTLAEDYYLLASLPFLKNDR